MKVFAGIAFLAPFLIIANAQDEIERGRVQQQKKAPQEKDTFGPPSLSK